MVLLLDYSPIHSFTCEFAGISDSSDSLFWPSESQDARKASSNGGYTSKVKVLDRYKVVGFISSGTYGRVYKAVGHNGQTGEFAIKKCVVSFNQCRC